MSSFSRKSKRKKPTFNDLKGGENTVSAVWKKAAKKTDKIVNKAEGRVAAMYERFNRYFTGLRNIIVCYVLRKHMRMSVDDTMEFIQWLQFKSECITDGYVTYKEIEEFEVKSTDKSYSPLGWTDYLYPTHSITGIMDKLVSDDSTDEEIGEGIYRCRAIRIFEGVAAYHELLTLSSLNDHCGYKLVRCKRAVTQMRELEYSTPDEIIDMAKWLCKTGLEIFDNKEFMENVHIWKDGLKTASMKAVIYGDEFKHKGENASINFLNFLRKKSAPAVNWNVMSKIPSLGIA